MRTSPPCLLPVFRSQHQAQLLAELLATPGAEFGITDLAQRANVPLTTAVRETQRLVASGLLRERHLGRNRLVRADPANPATAPLAQLVLPAFGPRHAVAQHFSALPGVEKVIIFGSWAARFHGEPGRPPRDLDVLIVADLDTVSQLDILEAAEAAERALNIPVSPVLTSPQHWTDPNGAGDILLIGIHSRPYVVAYDASTQPVPA